MPTTLAALERELWPALARIWISEDACLEASGQQTQLAHTTVATKLLGQDGLAAACKTEDVARRCASGKGPALPFDAIQAQQPSQHVQGRVLDRRGDVLRRQVHLDILIHARDDVVGPLGNGQDAARDEAIVAAGRGLAGERRHDVVEDVSDDGFRPRGPGRASLDWFLGTRDASAARMALREGSVGGFASWET